MSHTRFLSQGFDPNSASTWVEKCATSAGWSDDEAGRLASCVAESAQTVSKQAYHMNASGPVFMKLDLNADNATLELHHEGALGDKPCDCAAAKVASELVSTNWKDAQLRTHRLTIARS